MSAGKRAFDLAACALAGVIFGPVLAVAAVAIRLGEGEGALFCQGRVGLRREAVTVLKLRTMHEGAVTAPGARLRKTGLDEVLQFVNVWRGEMSVVGPRPLTPEDVARLGWAGPEVDWRWDALPGITGLAQLFGTDAASALALDRAYLARPSLRVDAELVALSFVVNLAGKARGRRLALWLPTRARAVARGALGVNHDL